MKANSPFSDIKSKTPRGFSNTTIIGNLNGNIDDIRIYATALSAEDIKQLYESRAKVDKTGKIFTNQFNEKSNFDENNLIYNGMLELGSTAGFTGSGISYNATDCFRGSNGCIVVNNSNITTNDYIPICDTDTYKFEIDLKFVSITNNKYLALVSYDQHKGELTYASVNYKTNTKTTLAQAVNNGDTEIELTSSANWVTNTSTSAKYARVIGICNYPEFGYDRARNNEIYYSSITGNTLKLEPAWNAGSFAAGTQVRNSLAGNTYFYFTKPDGSTSFTPTNAPKEWTHYEFTVRGNQIRRFTNYIRFQIVNGRWRI